MTCSAGQRHVTDSGESEITSPKPTERPGPATLEGLEAGHDGLAVLEVRTDAVFWNGWRLGEDPFDLVGATSLPESVAVDLREELSFFRDVSVYGRQAGRWPPGPIRVLWVADERVSERVLADARSLAREAGIEELHAMVRPMERAREVRDAEDVTATARATLRFQDDQSDPTLTLSAPVSFLSSLEDVGVPPVPADPIGCGDVVLAENTPWSSTVRAVSELMARGAASPMVHSAAASGSVRAPGPVGSRRPPPIRVLRKFLLVGCYEATLTDDHVAPLTVDVSMRVFDQKVSWIEVRAAQEPLAEVEACIARHYGGLELGPHLDGQHTFTLQFAAVPREDW